MKLYVSSDAAERKKSLRDQYTQKIHEQENAGKVFIALIFRSMTLYYFLRVSMIAYDSQFFRR